MLHKIPTNECHIEVTPKSPWLRERTAKEEYRQCEHMAVEIKRHVDDVGHTFINQKYVWTDERGYEWDELYDALEELYAEDAVRESFKVRYERPNDNGTGTRKTVRSFEKMIEAAWLNPWKFECISGPQLTEDQQTFLNRVIAESLKSKEVAV